MEEGERTAEPNVASIASATRGERPEVALQWQVLTARQHRIIKLASNVMLLLSTFAFANSLTFAALSSRILTDGPVIQVVNLFFSSASILSLGFLLLVFLCNLVLVLRAGLHWTKRKRVLVCVALTMLLVQLLNSIFFLVPTSSLGDPCAWFKSGGITSGYLSWSCWNTLFCLMAVNAHNIMPIRDSEGRLRRGEVDGKQQSILVMDASPAHHLPKLVVWLLFEFTIVFLAAANADRFNFRVTVDPETASLPCENRTYRCSTGTQYRILTTTWVIFLFIYVLMIQAYIRATQRRLLLAPYKDHADVHLMVLQQKRQMSYISLIGIFSVPPLWFTRWDLCNNYFVAWLGLLPLQVIVSSMVFVHALYYLPMRPNDQSVQHSWLQEFAWLESGLGEALSQRAKHSETHRKRLLKEPLFCFETGIKLLLWSELVYDFKEEDGQPAVSRAGDESQLVLAHQTADSEGNPALGTSSEGTPGTQREAAAASASSAEPTVEANIPSPRRSADQADWRALLQTAMDMYDLQEYEVIYEPLLETRVLLSWSNQALVVAFRGTAGLANVRSDVKVWRVAHPPRRGSWLLGSQPLVHKGFLETWRVNGLDRRVLSRVLEIVDAGNTAAADFAIYLTGHSLGGALATLAAIDLQRERVFPRLAVYTYGAPRTGNHAFARDYQALVPQTWQIINDRDAVPRSGKFWVLYKRPGQRTLINQVGDIRVRPTVMEVSIHSTGMSIKQHYLVSYLKALWSICVSQCIASKALPGGREAIDSLARSAPIQAYFETLGVDLRGLAGTEEGRVLQLLPSLKSAGDDLRCCWGWPAAAVGILRDLVPVSENAVATLSMLVRRIAPRSAESPAEEGQPGHLANRLGSIRRRGVASLSQRGASVVGAAPETNSGDHVQTPMSRDL